MKLNPNYIAREIVGELVIIPVGPAAETKAGLISTNEVGAFIWEKIESGHDEPEILEAILNEFDVDEATASADMKDFIQRLRDVGAVVD